MEDLRLLAVELPPDMELRSRGRKGGSYWLEDIGRTCAHHEHCWPNLLDQVRKIPNGRELVESIKNAVRPVLAGEVMGRTGGLWG